MREYTIKLTEEQANIVLNALAARPYFEVAELIGKIKNDCEAQLLGNTEA